jgi:hypothetical protein
MRAILGSTFLILMAAACAAPGEEETCSPNLAPDGVYPGYDYCSAARYPDFTDPARRWDGTYPEGCVGVTGEDTFACAEQLFWQALQFEPARRADGFAAMRALVAREEAAPTLDERRRSRLSFRAGQLGVALVAENGDTSPGPIVQRYLERAVELDPDDDVILEAWLYTVKINAAVILGQDPAPYLDEVWALYERDRAAVAGTVMVLAAGMPLDSGWPDVAVQLVDAVDLDDCGGFCGWAAYRAPYALPGQYFSYAEVEARAGHRERTVEFLELTRAQPRYATWPLREAADQAYADVDAFLGRFAARAPDASVADLMLSGSTSACRVCHAPLPGP